MANKKISQLTAAAPLTGTEILPIVQGGNTVQATAQDIADLGGGGITIPVVSTYPVTTSGLAGTLFWYKGNLWHYMTQDEIDSAFWTGLVSVGFPAPVMKNFNINILTDLTGVIRADVDGFFPTAITNGGNLTHTVIDTLGYGNPTRLRYFACNPGFGEATLVASIKNAQLLNNLFDIGTERAVDIRNAQLSATALNNFFTDLPSTSLVCTLDVRGNPGSATCNPTIATAKGYTVVTS